MHANERGSAGVQDNTVVNIYTVLPLACRVPYDGLLQIAWEKPRA